MTDAVVATSRPLRAIVTLLSLWAGGRAVYEFAPRVIATTRPAPFVAHAIAANTPSKRPNPQFHPKTTNTDLPKLAATIRTRRAVALPQRSRGRSLIAYRIPEPSLAASIAQPLTESISQQTEARLDVRSRPAARQRLSLSSWLLVRDGTTGITPAGILGSSQVGARAYLSVTDGISITGRISAPLRTSGAETSIGLALRHGPVTLLLERRFALESGGRNDFSATLAAGVEGVRLPVRFRLNAYGQAGIVGRDAFADGAVRIDRQIIRRGKSEVAVGAGVWGGAQPGIARVDAGPQVVVRTPVAGGYLRASGEWRQRITGNAQPASGPAVTLGMDF